MDRQRGGAPVEWALNAGQLYMEREPKRPLSAHVHTAAGRDRATGQARGAVPRGVYRGSASRRSTVFVSPS